MAVYWVDPYINTPVGGIHGTTDTTSEQARMLLLSMDDLMGTGNTNISTINSTTLTSSDEIRFKGLSSISDFYYDIGTTGNTVTVTGIANNKISLSETTEYGTYRTELTTQGWDRAPFIYISDDLMGDNNFVIFQSGANMDTTTDGVPLQNNDYSHHRGFTSAKQGITSSDGDKMAFIDPDYISNTFASTTSLYNLQFAVALTLTDGWTSETVRDGVTLLCFRRPSGSGYDRWFKPNLVLELKLICLIRIYIAFVILIIMLALVFTYMLTIETRQEIILD